MAVIPARGGSKGIKDKNLQLVGSKSLVARAILAAQKVADIDRVIVSTDSKLIEKEAVKYGAEVHRRRTETSTDTARTIDVLSDVYTEMNIAEQTCVLLQPTSPLRDASHIRACIDLYKSKGSIGSVISVVPCDHHPFKMIVQGSEGNFVPVRDLADLEAPRQELPKALRINGAVYIIDFKTLINTGSFFSYPQQYVEMTENESIDIDNYADLVRANLLIEGNEL